MVVILSRPWFIVAVLTLTGASIGFGVACTVLAWKG